MKLIELIKQMKIKDRLHRIKSMKIKNVINSINAEDFKSLFSKKYPMTTKARKFWVTVVAIVIPAIVITIMLNLAHSKGAQQNDAEKERQTHQNVESATSEDLDWYTKGNQNAHILPDLSNKPLTQKEKMQLQNLMLGKGVGFGGNDVSSNGDDKDDETEKAMKAAISTNQITSGNNLDNTQNSQSLQNSDSPNSSISGKSNSDSATQGDKLDFLNKAQQGNPDYLGELVQNPLSPYELQAGAIIPAVLITGISSDLPGQITAQVTENIYDSISGNNLLIPQGTKVVGLYDSKVAYGQERVLVAWKRIIFPNGKSLDLDGMPGIDLSGYAGFTDQINNHYLKIFGSVILMSIMGAGAQLSQPQMSANNPYGSPSINQMIAQSLGTNLANTANSITQKNINIQPTLEIRPGYQFNISVTRDMLFPSPMNESEFR